MSDAIATKGFVPGARVAVRRGYHLDHEYAEHRVGKVYKGGNFILEGDVHRQQWRPGMDNRRAHPTGSDGWRRDIVLLWDEETDKEISEGIAAHNRSVRLSKIRTRIERLRREDVTDEIIAAIEAALPIIKDQPK